jgi:hypothetical protein
MRRLVFRALGILELLSALVLFGFVWSLPRPADVHERVGRVENVGKQTAAQVERLRVQVAQVREKQPQARRLADDMRTQVKALGAGLELQQLEPATLQTMYDSLGDVAKGLDGLSDIMSPEGFSQLGAALFLAAEYLDKQVCPAADRAADQLDKSLEAVKRDSRNIAALLRGPPPDLKTAREVNDSLHTLGDGLNRLGGTMKPEHVKAMREGLQGLETALQAGAERVAALASYVYPVVTMNGYLPEIDYKKFWPEGGEVAEGLYKAAKGAAAARKELDLLADDLPHLRESVLECRAIVERTRQAMSLALAQQVKLETLMKDIPEQTIRMSEELPKLGAELSRLLRETARLREVAAGLRGAHKGLDQTMQRWPALRRNLARSSDLLRASQTQMKYIIDHRAEYEQSAKESRRLLDTLADAVPLYTDQLGRDLDEQERSLANLGTSINEVNAVLPEAATTGARLLLMTRLLLSLGGAIFLLHGGYVAASSWGRAPVPVG